MDLNFIIKKITAAILTAKQHHHRQCQGPGGAGKGCCHGDCGCNGDILHIYN